MDLCREETHDYLDVVLNSDAQGKWVLKYLIRIKNAVRP